ncbi:MULTISPECIES: TRAP transporter small permease [Enterococcus]|uniref:C4-dicarboxylate ABC transporter n=1 Tax=Enterococcus mundtii TaxID=53346 RepID=A0ABQ0VB80_ENTMU|nr:MULTISPECIES: TRAP transporter small permease [Enterococcus]GEN17095.1 C4-dicarboxylate ABC transporter [Ligilactobacillus acidipiscis]AUB54233.1 TRAP transporter small permease protein [Enterococcus mundtii]MDB7086910.1 TRAP transporter small permease [Enterococcus mundtii]MZZ58887.1 TRAP transporter small permease subunit [Enterococcus mundtii]MZZ61818.1 TRAP transporter small permease subunit [Enterococcus mundtii]
MKKGISRLLEFLGACLLIGMIIIVLWQVFSRTILGNPNTVTEELVRFGLVWFAMLSSAYVVGQKGHLAVTLLSEKLTGTKANVLEIVVQCLFLAFAITIMVYGGWNAVTLTMGQISPSLGIPMGYVYLSVPVSGVLIIIYSLINLIEAMNGKSVVQEKG